MEPDGGVCRSCGAGLEGRFCELCGADSVRTRSGGTGSSGTASTGTASSGTARWVLVATADRPYFEMVRALAAEDMRSAEFPDFCPPRRFLIDDEKVTIGRSDRARASAPKIDLAGPPEDPGVSRVHARLEADGFDGWWVTDTQSRNGIYVNDLANLITPGIQVPLTAGDRIYLGAWTSLLLTRE